MIRSFYFISIFSISLLYGCALTTQTRPSPQMLQAENLIQNGKNKEAAAIYKQLAAVESDQQNQFRLLTADALIRANDSKQAKQYINLLDVKSLSPAQQQHLTLLYAQTNLSSGNAERAIPQLKAIQIGLLEEQPKIAYYQSLAFAYSLTGDFLQSAQVLLNIDPLLQNKPVQLAKHYTAILTTLSSLSEEALYLNQPIGANLLNGWMSLARVFKLDPSDLTVNLEKWRKQYPVHPANSVFLANYVKTYQHNLEQLPLIAVFLPKSGPYSAPAEVIKTGFVAAHKLAKKNTAANTRIRFYDTAENSPVKLYERAVQEGAQLIVGPLDKKDIKALVNGANLTVPVLALNHVEGLSHSKLYQFGLSPIDDAQQITVKARNDGHSNAALIVPKTEQGKRFTTYITESWQTLGGKIVNISSYKETDEDFSALVKTVLNSTDNIDSADADVVIMNAYAKAAKYLKPNLTANEGTANIPVYATSQVYLGEANAARDKDLNGITFCDIPWLFPQAYSGDLSQAALRDSWHDLSPSYLRLLPLGIDAYNLMSHLTELKQTPYSGATGRLSLDTKNKVNRELFCAEFVEGVPKAMSFATEKNAHSEPTPGVEKIKPSLPDLSGAVKVK
jgi:outer membrane PBP1 activator LpoA protein